MSQLGVRGVIRFTPIRAMIRLEYRRSPSVGRRGTYGPCVRTCIFTCLRIDAHMDGVPCDDVSIYLALSTLWSARNGYQCCQCCILIGRYLYLRAYQGGRGAAHSLVSYYGTKARRSIVNMISRKRAHNSVSFSNNIVL